MSTLMEQRARLVKEAEALAGKSADMFTAEDAARADELAARIAEISGKLKAAAEHKDRIDGFLAAPKTARRAETTGRTPGERFAKAFIAATGGHLESGQTWRMKDDPEPEPEPAGDGVLKRDAEKLGTYGYAKGESRFPLIDGGSVLDLFGAIDVPSNGVEYLRYKIVSDTDPEMLNDGDQKTEVEFDYDLVTVDIEEIGAFTRVTDWMLEDEAVLARKIDDTLFRLIRRREEAQVLGGDGDRPNLPGVLNDPGIQTLEATEDNLVDQLLLAITMVEVTDLTADAIAMNKNDWFKLRTRKDENGQYIFGGPAFGPYGNGTLDLAPNPWGVVVARSNAIPEGTILVGNFANGATRYYRTPVRYAATDSNRDDFEHDRKTLRGFRRMGFGVDYPQAFVKVTIGEEPGN